MAENEFAPVTPGEMLREEFLTEYGLSQNQLAKAIGISPNRITEIVNNRRRIAADTAAPPGLVLRQQPGVLAEPTNELRSEDGAAETEAARCQVHQSAARCLKGRSGRSIRTERPHLFPRE